MYGRLDSLTGLRFFAAMLVVAFHVSLDFDTPAVAQTLASAGHVGVTFFFVLSGFVLMWSWRGGTARAFWWRRFARIWPLGALAALFILGFAVQELDPAASITNLLLLQAWHADPSWHMLTWASWSLSVEVFFYALFPLLIVVLPRRPLRAVLGVLAVMAVVASMREVLGAGPYWFVVFPPARLGEFAIGVLLAAAMRDGWRPRVRLSTAVLLAAMAYAVVMLLLGPQSRQLAAVATAPAFAVLIAAAAAADLEGGSALASRWLVRLGEASFALYLVHGPVLWLFEKGGATGAGWAPVAAGAAVAASCVLFVGFERPVERWLRALPARRRGREPVPEPARA